MLARVRLAQGRNDEASEQSWLRSPLRQRLVGERAHCSKASPCKPASLDAQGDQDAAVAILIKALALAEPEGFVRIFVDEGEGMQSLLVAAARQLESASDPGFDTL